MVIILVRLLEWSAFQDIPYVFLFQTHVFLFNYPLIYLDAPSNSRLFSY